MILVCILIPRFFSLTGNPPNTTVFYHILRQKAITIILLLKLYCVNFIRQLFHIVNRFVLGYFVFNIFFGEIIIYFLLIHNSAPLYKTYP